MDSVFIRFKKRKYPAFIGVAGKLYPFPYPNFAHTWNSSAKVTRMCYDSNYMK